MKSLIAVLIMAFFVGCSTLSSNPKIELMDYKETKLKNGLPVLLMKDKSLPYVSYVLLVKSGSSSDPLKLSGLSSMTAALLKRGTATKSATQIAESLDQIGADFSASVSKDYTVISASGLSFHQDNLLNVYSEIVTEPSFPSGEINRVRSLTISGLQQSVDNPGGFVSGVLDSYPYGDHPYGANSSGTISDVKRIRKKNIIRHYVSTYRPNNAHLAVVGNFSSDIIEKLNKEFADWKPRKIDPLNVPGFPKIKGLQINLIDRADLQQTQIRFGHKGIKRTNPDFLSLRVANTILGGAFASRLVDEIRKKRGLTYSIGSFFDSRKSEGPFVISTFTRHDKVKETIKETINVLERFRSSGVTEAEVKEAKALLKGSFPRAVETPEALAQNLLILRFYGISDSYLTNYLANVDDISTAEVNRAIKKYFTPSDMKVLVYSSKNKVLSQLKPLGEVTVKNYKDFL